MTMSIRKMTQGSGVAYLLSSVARDCGCERKTSDLEAYYTQSGTPPGRFIGSGLAGLNNGEGVAVGTPVSEEHLHRLLGNLQDPVTGEQLGARPQTFKPGGPKPVSGYDLTFSAPKSVSVAWALGDAATREAIYQAHEQSLAFVLGYAEKNFMFTRSGHGGIVEEDIRGAVATAFDHWDSRAGDPQLHTHVVVVNRVQRLDGAWSTLDGRGLYANAVSMSELYNSILADHLTRDLGYGWESAERRHSPVPKWEVAGVSEALRDEFSQRSHAIEDAKTILVAEFVASHGRQPSDREVLKLRQQATLATRPDKEHHSLSDLAQGWKARAVRYVGADPVAWVETLAGRNELPVLHAGDLADEMLLEAAKIAVSNVAEKRATFRRNNVYAETVRQMAGIRFASDEDRTAVLERTTSMGLGESLLISPPELTTTPEVLQRADGTTRFLPTGHAVFTTRSLLDAETRLVEAGRSTSGPSVSQIVAEDVCHNTWEGRKYPLSRDQRAAVQAVVTSGRTLDIMVGPAGSGKSTAMAGVRACWEKEHGPRSVIGLAPSAAAAEVLQDELNIPTDNTAKWLTESALNPGREADLAALRKRLRYASPSVDTTELRARADKLARQIDTWTLHPGQLVIVDEASMAGTFDLDTLTEQAGAVGAKVLLVGDWAQLSSVSAGGAFQLLATDREEVATLHDIRRFKAGWERKASVAMRRGDPDVPEVYDSHGRLEGGDRDGMLEMLYNRWHADEAAGKKSLMIAGDSQTVGELNDRARADRVLTGEVAPGGITTARGSTVGEGDLVVTRQNARGMTGGGSWVKNGDLWHVKAVEDDGSLLLRRANGPGVAVLPAGYAAEHVELGYATTAHRAQGRTVDTCHAFISATQVREVAYVAATRGKEGNFMYVDTMYDPDPQTSHGPIAATPAVDVLRNVLARSGADLSAHAMLEATWDEAHSNERLWAEYDTMAQRAAEPRYVQMLEDAGVLPSQMAQVRESAAFGPLLAAMRDGEARGMDLQRGLPDLVQGRTLAGVDDVASVLHGRVDKWVKQSGRPPVTVAGLGPVAVGVTDPEMARALQQRADLIEARTAKPEPEARRRPAQPSPRRTVDRGPVREM